MRARAARFWGVALILAGLTGVAGFMTLRVVHHVPTNIPAPPNYSDDASWLCRPGRDDACGRPTTATIVEPGGARRTVTYKAALAAPIDCFYLYPTVSRVRAAYSPIAITAQEEGIARAQLARFAAVCRPFAPLYRQVTLAGLPDLFGRDTGHVNLTAPYADVLAAWKSYLANDNAGRGVVLIGHSQGARLLARLMAEEIDGKPIQAQLVSAIVPGTDVDVPVGGDVGGSFKHIPLCRSAGQTGCVIAYSSYPADRPATAKARFGTTKTVGMTYACVDPTALAGSPHLDADLPLDTDPALRARLGTDFLELPGVFTAACKTDGSTSFLAIGVASGDALGEANAALLDHLAQYQPANGLHSFDIALTLGTLVDLVHRQAASFASR